MSTSELGATKSIFVNAPNMSNSTPFAQFPSLTLGTEAPLASVAWTTATDPLSASENASLGRTHAGKVVIVVMFAITPPITVPAHMDKSTARQFPRSVLLLHNT